MITAFLRLGAKYDIETIRAEALGRLFFEFPTDLASFDRACLDSTNGMIEVDSGACIDAANLAREFDVLSILPTAAFWACRAWEADELGQGYRRTNGTISTLSSINQRACFGAHFSLLKLKEQNTYDWVLSPPSDYPACTTLLPGGHDMTRCAIAREKLLRTIFFPTAVSGCLVEWNNEWEKRLCDHCIVKARQWHEEGRHKTWDALPGVFGLPSWEELEKERDTRAWYVPTSR